MVETNSLYQYMFYVIPDLYVASDMINPQILEALSSQDFNSILLSKTNDPIHFPTMQEFESEKI